MRHVNRSIHDGVVSGQLWMRRWRSCDECRKTEQALGDVPTARRLTKRKELGGVICDALEAIGTFCFIEVLSSAQRRDGQTAGGASPNGVGIACEFDDSDLLNASDAKSAGLQAGERVAYAPHCRRIGSH